MLLFISIVQYSEWEIKFWWVLYSLLKPTRGLKCKNYFYLFLFFLPAEKESKFAKKIFIIYLSLPLVQEIWGSKPAEDRSVFYIEGIIVCYRETKAAKYPLPQRQILCK